MVNAALYYPSLFALMNYGLRLLPIFAVTKQLIEGGFCGALQLCECRVESGPVRSDNYDWTCDGAMGGGILSTLGVHVVDAILFLTDQDPVLVSGCLKSLDGVVMSGFRRVTSDNFCTFQLEMAGGLCVNASLGVRSSTKSDFSFELYFSGTKGALRVRNFDLYGRKWDSDEEELLFSDSESAGRPICTLKTRP